MKSTADVVIIGGGCMGTSVAFHLARRGIRDVVLVEREPLLATGSTGKNAGGVRHQWSSEANIRLSLESIRLMEHFAEEVGYPVDFHQDGYLFLLSAPTSVDVFQKNVALQRRLGVDVEWLDGPDAERLVPGLRTEGVLAATFCARDGIADPNGVTMGFANAARSAGVAIERDTEVTGIRIESGRIAAVETTRGTIETRIVVNAAGPHAKRVGHLASVNVPVEPHRRHIFIATVDLEAAAPLVVPHSHIMVIDFETTFYCHREGAGILLGMGDLNESSTFDMTVQWDFLPKVMDVAVTRLPALGHGSISHAWAGLYEMSPDGSPIVGPVRDVEGLFLINGFSGHGFQHSPAAGRILADVIAGRDPEFDIAPFALERFHAGSSSRECCVV